MRDSVRYGGKIFLYCQAFNGPVLATNSALMPVGVLPDDPTRDPPPFERAVFLVVPGEGDHRSQRRLNEEVKFGQVIRLVHEATGKVVSSGPGRHAHLDKGNLRVSLEYPQDHFADEDNLITASAGDGDEGRRSSRSGSLMVGGGGGGRGLLSSTGTNAADATDGSLAAAAGSPVSGSSSSFPGGASQDKGAASNAKGGVAAASSPTSSNKSKLDKWRILPRFKVRGEGERVRDGDHIVLQAASGEQFFLHVSKGKDSDHFHELNSGLVAEGFALNIYDRDILVGGRGGGDSSGGLREDRVIRGGTCIMLFHKEERGYVYADTTNKTCVLDPYDEPVVGVKGLTGSGAAPFNSKMMFIVEFDNKQRGGIVTSGRKQLFRLKALASHHYLCVRSKAEKVTEKSSRDGMSEMGGSVWSVGASAGPTAFQVSEFGITLTNEPSNVGTLFAFHQAAEDQGSFICNRTRLFLECPGIEQGTWLSVGNRVTTRMVTEMLSSMGKRSSRPKKKLAFQDVQSMKDGLEVQRVPQKAYAMLINVLALIPPLEAFAAHVAQDIPNYQLLNQARENLTALRSFSFVGEFSLDSNDLQATERELLKGTVDAEGQRRLVDQGIASIAMNICKKLVENPIIDLNLLGTSETVGGMGSDAAGGAASGKTSTAAASSDSLVHVKYADVQDIFSMCFGLVQDMVRGAPTNALAIAGEIPFIVQCAKRIPSALDCLVECFKNNPSLVETPDDMATLKFLCDWLQEAGRDERILNVLTLLVECEGIHLTSAQNYVCETLLRRRDVASRLFVPFTSAGGTQVGILPWYTTPRSTQQQLMRRDMSFSFGANASMSASSGGSGGGGAESGGRVANPSQVEAAGAPMTPLVKVRDLVLAQASATGQQSRMDQFVQYLSRQLFLFAGLCSGRNTAAISIVQQLVPVESILPMMMNDDIPAVLRAAFVKLFNASVVDVEGAVDLEEHIRCIRHVIDDPQNAETYSVEREVPEMLGNSKRFAMHYLRKTHGRLDVSQPDNVLVTDGVLQLVAALLQRGMFLLSEFQELIFLLARVLDSRTDAVPRYASDAVVGSGGEQSAFILELRFRVPEESKPLIHVKVRALKIITFVLDLILTQHVSTVVNNFTRGRPVGHLGQLIDVDPFTRISAISCALSNRRNDMIAKCEKEFSGDINDAEYTAAADFSDKELAMSPLGGILEEGPLLPVLSYLVGVLMNISQYQDARMRVGSIQLYCILTNFPMELLRVCRRVQLLTSHASAGFYNNVKQLAVDLERGSGLALKASGQFTLTFDRMSNASACLERLESMLALREGGAMIEKIAMMRHVGVPTLLTQLLSAIPVNPREEYRRFVFDSIGMLKTLAQDSLIAEMLCERATDFTHLTSSDLDILSLLRVLYVNMEPETPITAETVKQVVLCMGFPALALPAVLFLQDLLGKKDAKGRYVMRNQVLVWRALLADNKALRALKFRAQWSGKRGRPMRDSLLSGRDYFNPTGSLRLHLEVVKLVFLVTKFNESVRPEEVRYEVFGDNAVEDLMEVVTNRRLPTFYRHNYLMLMQVLIIDDREGFHSLLGHRNLPDFIEMCRQDIRMLATLCDVFETSTNAVEESKAKKAAALNSGRGRGALNNQSSSRIRAQSSDNNDDGFDNPALLPTVDDGEDEDGGVKLPFVIDPLVRVCAVENAMDQAVEERRGGIAFLGDHVTLAVVPALEKLIYRVMLERSSRLSTLMKGMIISSLNELIDAVCDLARQIFIASSRSYREYPTFGERVECRRQLKTFLLEAVRLDCKGTEAWSDDIALLALAIPTEDTDDRGSGEEIDAGAREEKALTNRWLDYLRLQLETCDAVSMDNNFASAAGIILRSGPAGSRFAAILVKGLDEVTPTHQLSCFHITRQIASLRPLNPFDDSVLLTFDPAFRVLIKPRAIVSAARVAHSLGSTISQLKDFAIGNDIEKAAFEDGFITIAVGQSPQARILGIGALTAGVGFNAAPGDPKVTAANHVAQRRLIERLVKAVSATTECVSIDQPLRDRQTIMAKWGHDYSDQVLPTIVALFSTDNTRVLEAGMRCAITLLDGGVRRMQDTFINWVKDRNDEEIFIVLRNRLSNCRDNLRLYSQLKKRDVDPGQTLELVPLYSLVLRFIQLLCEGHNEELQHYLRTQPDNQISVNVLESLEEVLEVTCRVIDEHTVHFCQQLLATIAETIQGPCRSNQDMLVGSGIADYLVRLLSLPANIPGCTAVDVQRLRLLAMTALLSLLEGRTETGFISMVIASLDLRTLGAAMDRSLQDYEQEHGVILNTSAVTDIQRSLKRFAGADARDHNEFEDELNVGCSLFIFFKSCLDLQQLHGVEFLDRRGVSLRNALRVTNSYKTLNKKVAMIELIRNGALERVYFRIPSVCEENLRRKSRKNLIKCVNRDSDNERLQDFFERCMKLITEVEYYNKLRALPVAYSVHENIHWVENVAIILSYAVNLAMLVTFHVQEDIYATPLTVVAEWVLFVLGLLTTIFEGMLLAYFGFAQARVMLNEYWTVELDAINHAAVQESRGNMSIEPPVLIRDIARVVSLPSRIRRSIQHILLSNLFWQRAIFFISALLGLIHSPIWYSVLVLQITTRSEQLANVIYAVTQNYRALLLTSFLLLCIAYVFAAVAYANFSAYFNPYADAGNGMHCRSLWHCAVIHVIFGVMEGGMHSITTKANLSPAFGWAKVAYEFCYFVILIILFLNIVLGIIIDTFAELRERRSFVMNDQQSKCFICGLEQNMFDKVTSGGFDHHVRFEHNMWNYLYFFHYVKVKNPEDHNGQEHAVFQQMMAKDMGFFPVGRAMMIEGTGGSMGGDGGGGGHGDGGGHGGGELGGLSDILAPHMMGAAGGGFSSLFDGTYGGPAAGSRALAAFLLQLDRKIDAAQDRMTALSELIAASGNGPHGSMDRRGTAVSEDDGDADGSGLPRRTSSRSPIDADRRSDGGSSSASKSKDPARRSGVQFSLPAVTAATASAAPSVAGSAVPPSGSSLGSVAPSAGAASAPL